MGIVYLIHLDRPHFHARHYVGYTSGRLLKRIEEHRASRGSRLLAHLNKIGIGWSVVRTWEGKEVDRTFERKIKQNAHILTLCPVCRRDKLRYLALQAQRRRERMRHIEKQRLIAEWEKREC